MTRFWFKQFLMFFFSLSQKIISTLSLKNCKNLKTSLFKCLEHSFLISRSIQNFFLKSFLWPTLNLDGLEGFVSHSQKTVSFSSLKNLQKSEKFPFQMLKTFFSELKVASKPFSKKLLMTKFWFKNFLMSCLTFPESGINFVTRKLQKTEIFFQILRTFVFDLKVASEPFSNKLLMTDFEFKWFWRLSLAFPENVFNFVTQKLAKNWKILFSNTQNIRFWAQSSLKTIF